MGNVHDGELDTIVGDRVMEAGDLVRFNQGRLHEVILQKGLALVQEGRFV